MRKCKNAAIQYAFLTLSLVLATCFMPSFIKGAFSQNNNKETGEAKESRESAEIAKQVKKLLADKDPESGKPKVIKKWGGGMGRFMGERSQGFEGSRAKR